MDPNQQPMNQPPAPRQEPMQQAPQQPQVAPQSAASTPTKSGHAGPVVGSIIIIVLLALGALYFYGAKLNQQQDQLPYIPADDGSAMMNEGASTNPTEAAAAVDASVDTSGIDQLQADIDASMSDLEGQL